MVEEYQTQGRPIKFYGRFHLPHQQETMEDHNLELTSIPGEVVEEEGMVGEVGMVMMIVDSCSDVECQHVWLKFNTRIVNAVCIVSWLDKNELCSFQDTNFPIVQRELSSLL